MLVGVDSTVKYLNKLTWPRAETKKRRPHPPSHLQNEFSSIDMSAGRLVSKEWFKMLVTEKRLLAFIDEGLLVI